VLNYSTNHTVSDSVHNQLGCENPNRLTWLKWLVPYTVMSDLDNLTPGLNWGLACNLYGIFAWEPDGYLLSP